MTPSEKNEKILHDAINSLPSSRHVLRFYAALVSALSLSAPVQSFAEACAIATIAIRIHDDEHTPSETIQ